MMMMMMMMMIGVAEPTERVVAGAHDPGECDDRCGAGRRSFEARAGFRPRRLTRRTSSQGCTVRRLESSMLPASQPGREAGGARKAGATTTVRLDATDPSRGWLVAPGRRPPAACSTDDVGGGGGGGGGGGVVSRRDGLVTEPRCDSSPGWPRTRPADLVASAYRAYLAARTGAFL